MSLFKFKLYVETQTGHILKSIQTDNAKELLSLKTYLASHLMVFITDSFVHTHEQNGSIDRKHRHIV